MGKFSVLPVDVFPLVACLTAGVGFMVYSGIRTTFWSGEVNLTGDSRQDELQEDPSLLQKAENFRRKSAYAFLGKFSDKPSFLGEPSFCKPGDPDDKQ